MKQAAFRTTAPPMGLARRSQAPGARSLYTSDSDHSHKSCPTSSCDSCFGFIYDNDLYESNSEELDDDADEDVMDDYGSDGWDQSQSQSQFSQSQASSVCPTPVAGYSHSQVTTTDPFCMSSMSSLFGPSSWSSSSPFSQQSQCQSPFGAPAPAPVPTSRRRPPPFPAPLGSSRKESRSAQRCSCQKSSGSKGSFSNAFSSSGSPPPSGAGNGQSQNQSQGTTADTQLYIFSNSQQTGTDNQDRSQTDSQALGHILSAKGKNGKGMVKNLNMYNPNITIQVTPEDFSKIFPGKKSAGQRSGSTSGQK